MVHQVADVVKVVEACNLLVDNLQHLVQLDGDVHDGSGALIAEAIQQRSYQIADEEVLLLRLNDRLDALLEELVDDADATDGVVAPEDVHYRHQVADFALVHVQVVILKVRQLLNVPAGECRRILQQLNDAVVDGSGETVRQRGQHHGNAIDPQVNVLPGQALVVVQHHIQQGIAHVRGLARQGHQLDAGHVDNVRVGVWELIESVVGGREGTLQVVLHRLHDATNQGKVVLVICLGVSGNFG